MNPKIVTPKQLDALYQQIGKLPDGRKSRGIRHHYRTVLTIALAAVVCGAKSFIAIGEFATLLTRLSQLGASEKYFDQIGISNGLKLSGFIF